MHRDELKKKLSKPSLIIIARIASLYQPDFFYYDREYHKISLGDLLYKKLSSKFPIPEKLFIRFGLCGICPYQAISLGVEFPPNPYNVEQNILTATNILNAIKAKDSMSKIVKYFKPYKTRDKNLQSLIENIKRQEGLNWI